MSPVGTPAGWGKGYERASARPCHASEGLAVMRCEKEVKTWRGSGHCEVGGSGMGKRLQAVQPCSHAESCSSAAMQPCSRAAVQPCGFVQPHSRQMCADVCRHVHTCYGVALQHSPDIFLHTAESRQTLRTAFLPAAARSAALSEIFGVWKVQAQ